MKLYLLLFGLCLATSTTTTTKEKTQKLKDTLANAATVLGDPILAGSLSALKELQTTSDKSIDQYTERAGFDQLHNIMDHGYGAVHVHKLDLLIKVWLGDSTFNALSEKYKDILSRTMKEYAMMIATEEYHKQVFDISFADGKGNMVMLWLKFTPHETNKNALLWEKYVISASFAPSAPFVVVTESDCSIFSCDSESRVVYMPATLTDAHINTVVQTNINMIMSFSAYARKAYA
jgi:hypothetical protein